MKKIISLILILCMVLSVVPAFAEEEPKWNIDENGVLIIEECGDFINENIAVLLGDSGDLWEGNEVITKVVLPDNVIGIGKVLFAGCTNLKEIVLPESLTDFSFYTESFSDCVKLESITISEKNEYYKSLDGALYSKDGKKLILYPKGKAKGEITIIDGVEEISAGVFKNCTEIEKVIFPNSLKTIKNEAFLGCVGLSEINLPESVTYIGEDAFSKCENLSVIKFPPYVYLQNNPFKDTAFYNNESNRTDGGLYLNKHLLEVDGTVTEFQIKPDTVSIAGEVFGGTKLKKIIIPASVRCIGDLAFALTDASTEIVFEEGLEILGNQAFYWSKIQNITLPQSLKIIGGYAFGDASIKRIVIPDNVIDIGEGAFEGSSVETVVIGKSVGNIGASAFANCYDLKSITIPDSVYALEGNALGTRWLENIHLGKNLQSFSEKVFGYNYPYNIRSITVSAESEYLSVKDNVVFDKKGEKILFYPNCKEEEEYVIPDGVKIIGEECFDYNSNFTTLTIPKSVITIEKYNNPSKLVNVKYAGTREEWEKIDIQSGCDVIKDAIITFSDGSTKNLHENLRYCEKDGKAYIIGLWDKDAQSVTIPGEIDGKEVVIGSSAFKSSKLVTVTLDESIKKIPYCAFQNCESLQNINLENVEHIDGQAFMYCTSLKNVNLLNIKSWSGISEERLDEKRMQLELTPNPWLYTYNISSVYTIFYGAKIENLRIKWPEENFEEGAQTFPAFFLNAEIKNVYFENFTVSPSLAEFYGIDTSRYIRTSDPDVDLTYPNSEMTIFGSSEDVKGYAEAIGVNFKYID
ncbi:MAG: leucine-rich repeat domain-containing protein [Clostridia bacterium]|nr:leucine-rich repeat domain-containing protein [Clostridia bacterium]